MADVVYNTQFRLEFDADIVQSVGGARHKFRVTFNRAGYSGSVIDVTGQDEPLLIENVDSDFDRLEGLWPLRFTPQVYCEAHWQAESMRVLADREMQLIIEIDKGSGFAVEHFGWVLPTDFKIDHSAKPYAVSVSASDGLSTLKTRPILDKDGKRLTGAPTLSNILRTALDLGGYHKPLVTGVNLFELDDLPTFPTPGQTVNVTKDPLFNTALDASSQVTDDFATKISLESIREVVEIFGCRLSQTRGQWWVIRADEAGGSWDVGADATADTIHTREYYGVNNYDGPLDGYDRSTNLVINVGEGYPARIIRGAVDILPTIEQGVMLQQTLGRYKSAVPVLNFTDVDGSNHPTGWEANNLASNRWYRTGNGTAANLYGLTIEGIGDGLYNGDTPSVSTKITYALDSRQYTKFIKRTLSGKFEVTNAKGAKLFFFAIRDDGNYYFVGGSWQKVGTLKHDEVTATIVENYFINAAGQQQAKTDYATFKIDLGTLDRVKALIIVLGAPRALDVLDGNGNPTGALVTGPTYPKIRYYALDLQETEVGNEMLDIQRKYVRPGQEIKDAKKTLTIGDIPVSANGVLRVNALIDAGSKLLTSLWYRPDATFAANPPSPKDIGLSLLSWLTLSYARQEMQTGARFEGDIIGHFPYGIHTVLRLMDYGDTVDGTFVPYKLQITRWKWSCKTSMHTVTATRILNDAPSGSLPLQKAYWGTENGPEPMEDDGSGIITGAPVSPVTSQIQATKANLANLGIFAPILPGSQLNVPGTVPKLPTDVIMGIRTYKANQQTGFVLSILNKLPFLKLLRG